jgi:hypothetical protein
VADLRPRTFRLVRTEDVTGVSGTGTVADGVAWPDGSVSVRWRGEHPSIVFWRDLEAVEAIHGHGGRTHLEWDLERVVPPDLSDVRKILTSAQQGEIEGWSQETQLELLWGIARHVDGLLAEVAAARDTVPARSEAAVLRAAADRFRRAPWLT